MNSTTFRMTSATPFSPQTRHHGTFCTAFPSMGTSVDSAITRKAPTATNDAARSCLLSVTAAHCLTATGPDEAGDVPSTVHADGPTDSVESVRSRTRIVVGPNTRTTLNDPHSSVTTRRAAGARTPRFARSTYSAERSRISSTRRADGNPTSAVYEMVRRSE